jgi:hypothetical protein
VKHRGLIIKRAVRNSGLPIVELARRMNRSRRHIYNIFENPNVSLVEVVQIGKIIHYDFANDFAELENLSSEMSGCRSETSVDPIYWKNKYITLLEKYNALLERVSGKNTDL